MNGIIVHEWMERTGGAERVVQAMRVAYPQAEVLALWSDLEDAQIRESWMGRSPLRHNKLLAIPAMLSTWRHQRAGEADWAIVSSHLFAHHVRFHDAAELPKYVYCHTPARYLWEPSLDTRGDSRFVRSAASIIKPIDRRRAQEAYGIAANSRFVAERIEKCWDRESAVIYPPVEVTELQRTKDWAHKVTGLETAVLDSLPDSYVLGASRFVSYKNLEFAIDVSEHAGIPAVIAGGGAHEGALRRRARHSKVPVYFVILPSDELLRAIMQKAIVFAFGAVEDFGIMPVEAMALGTPVICGRAGGVNETVAEGISGFHVDMALGSHLKQAVEMAASLVPETIAAHAHAFSRERFIEELKAWIGLDTKAVAAQGAWGY